MGYAVDSEFVAWEVGFEEEFIENCRVVLFIIEIVGTGGLDSCYLILILLRIMRVSLRLTKLRFSRRSKARPAPEALCENVLGYFHSRKNKMGENEVEVGNCYNCNGKVRVLPLMEPSAI